MARARLDGVGMIKMKTLDEALLLMQRINGLVEQYAMAVKRGQTSQNFIQSIRRALPTLADNLKSHFGMISDQILAVNLASSRGSSEAVRVRQLREGVALIKQAIEIAMTQTKDRHTVREEDEQNVEESSGEPSSNRTPPGVS
jgi:hypothetical protein